MANGDQPPIGSDSPLLLQPLVDYLAEKLFEPSKLARLERTIRNANAEAQTVANGATFAADRELRAEAGPTRKGIEYATSWLAAWILSLVVENTFDVSIDNTAFADFGARGGRRAVAKAVTDTMIESLTGGNKSVEPSPEPAARYLSVVFQQIFESWALGEMVEIGSAALPWLEKIEHVADLGDKVVNALGFTDSSARVLRPYIDNLVVEPLRRHIATTYRPNLLSENQAIRAFIAGHWDGAKLRKELAELGWSEDRMNELLATQYKNLSLEDMLFLVRNGTMDRGQVLEILRQEGFDEHTANFAVTAAEAKRFENQRDNVLPGILRAYLTNELTDSQFRTLVGPIIFDDSERQLYIDNAALLKGVSATHLSHGEVIDCVELGILPTSFYRAWLTREGYPPEEAIALELRLRARIDQQRTVDQHRKDLEAERAAEKAQREQEKADRLAKAEAERELARRGPLADLRRAAVRGLIPYDRVTEVLSAQYDPDFVSIFIDLVESDRVEYLRQQAQREDAEKRAANRRIDIGGLQQAVLEHVLDLGRFRQALRDRGIVDEDADILAATLGERLKDLDAAKAKRAAAEAAARFRHVDIGRMETLVRRGHRSIADYDAFLEDLGFDDASRAAMVDLLQLQIADDAGARKAREEAEAKLRAKGISLETARRAVILGLWTVDTYSQFLMRQGFAADAVALMVADVQHERDEAEAARKRRDQADQQPPAAALPLSVIRRAARLGVIDVDTYIDRLVAAGYSDDDIAIDTDLLVQEIADVQAARARQDQAEQPTTGGLTLTQLAAAVRAGFKTLDEYRAAAAADPTLSRDDVDTLVRVLGDELASTDVARARRAALASQVKPQDIALGELEARVRAGALSVQEYVGLLEGAGLDLVDIDLLTTLLVDELAGSTAP